MTPFEVYQCHVAMRKHFLNDSFDYVKYKGKIRLKLETFQKRRDRFVFEKLSKHENPKFLILANLLEDHKFWLTTDGYGSANAVYERWLKKIQSLSYMFRNELEELDDDFDKNFIVSDGQHPSLLQLYLAQKISLETLTILIDVTECDRYWRCKLGNDVITNDVLYKVAKYKPFLHYDKMRITSIIVDTFKNR